QVRLAVQYKDASGTHHQVAMVPNIDQVIGQRPLCAHETLLTRYVEHRLKSLLTRESIEAAVARSKLQDDSERQPYEMLQSYPYGFLAHFVPSETRRLIARSLARYPELFVELTPNQIVMF